MAEEPPRELEMLPPVPQESEDKGDVGDSSVPDGEETNDRCGIKWKDDDSFFEWEGIRVAKPLGMTESSVRASARRMDPAEKERLLREREEIRLMKAMALADRRRLEADSMEVVIYEPLRRMGG